MATVAMIIWPEPGHYAAFARLFHQLRDAGHDVRVLGLPDFEAQATAQGLDYVACGQDAFPPGSLPAQNPMPVILRSAELYEKFVGVWESALKSSPPALLIADALLPAVAIAGHGAGVKVVTVHVNFPYTRERGLPPLTTGLRPDPSLLGRVRTDLAWRASLLGRRAVERVGVLRGWPDEMDVLRELARRCSYPPDFISAEASKGYRLAFPELILCPEDLDFPHPPRANRHYIEPSIHLQRTQKDFPWERLRPDLDLVYFALGSQSHRYRNARAVERLLRAAIQVAGSMQGIQLVLATAHFDPAHFGPLPANVIAAKWLPQLDLLQRASLAVTHGGIGSIKEALFFGVPMIVFPLLRDQPGNAVRVAHHRVGLQGHVEAADADALHGLLQAARRDERIRAQASSFSGRFREIEASSPGAALLDRIARGSGEYGLVDPSL